MAKFRGLPFARALRCPLESLRLDLEMPQFLVEVPKTSFIITLEGIKDQTKIVKVPWSESLHRLSDDLILVVSAMWGAGRASAARNLYSTIGWVVRQYIVHTAIKSYAARKRYSLCWDTIEPLTVFTTSYQTLQTTYSIKDSTTNP